MSVEIEQMILADGLKLETRLPDSRWGIARLLIGELRNLHLAVGLDPLPENPYHAQVWGIGNKRLRRVLAERAQIIKEPQPLEAHGVP